MRPRVVLRDIHYRYQHYFDYLVTGFSLLAEAGEIEFECRPLLVTRAVQWHPRAAGALRRLLPRLERELARGDNWCIPGEVHLKDRVIRFAFDVDDSPFVFQLSLLQTCEVYFKCQHPAEIDPAGFPLTSRLRIPYHPDVMALREKIRPAMLGRPLSRTLNLRKNLEVLGRWESLVTAPKTHWLLAYFGTDRVPDPAAAPNENAIMRRYGTHLSHPNLKRGELVAWLRSKFPDGVDARIVDTDRAEIRGPDENDGGFPRTVARSMFSVNISGLRRSIPFKFVDSFLVGTAVLSDDVGVKWYRPFEAGVEVSEMGRLGYELPEDAEWDQVQACLLRLSQEAEARHREIRPRILENFRKYWHPRALGRYVLDECLAVA